MQVKPTAMTKFSNYIFKNYTKNSSKLLVHVGAGVLSVLTTSVVAGNIVGVYLGNVIATKMAEKKIISCLIPIISILLIVLETIGLRHTS